MTFPGDVVVEDYRLGPNAEIIIRNSALITRKSQRLEILQILYDFEAKNPTGWNRSVESMMFEWDVHNVGFVFSNLLPLHISFYNSSKNVNLDRNSEGWGLWDFVKKEIEKRIAR